MILHNNSGGEIIYTTYYLDLMCPGPCETSQNVTLMLFTCCAALLLPPSYFYLASVFFLP